MHRYRTEILKTLATLAGFHAEIALPDGCRPDVMRASLGRELFLGEAKHAESADDEGARRRIRHYGSWLMYFGPGGGILAVCHRVGHGREWCGALDSIAKEVSSFLPPPQFRRLALDAEVTWLVSSPLNSEPNQPRCSFKRRGGHDT
jgi:hypothetical protein